MLDRLFAGGHVTILEGFAMPATKRAAAAKTARKGKVAEIGGMTMASQDLQPARVTPSRALAPLAPAPQAESHAAEPVSARQQALRFLLEAGCGKVQGYLISRPLPLADLATLALGGVQSRSLPVGQIHMAIVDHIQWRKQLVQYAITMANLPADAPERQSQMPFCMAGHNCLLVRWYHGDGQVFERMPGFSRIGVALVDMAKVSQQLVAGIHAGAGPNDIADLIGEIQQISQDMLDVLTTLETNTMAGLDQWAVH